MLENFFNIFVVLFVVIDPVGLAPIFYALSHGADDTFRKSMAKRGVLVSAVLLVVFTLLGERLLGWLGISIDAFRIAGGFLLFLLSIDMVFARQSGLRSTTRTENSEAEEREDISVFPLAIPMIAGPGSMTTIILMLGDNSGNIGNTLTVIGILLLVLLLTYISLRFASMIMTRLGEIGTNVISRVLGILLAALAVQYMIDGLRASLFTT